MIADLNRLGAALTAAAALCALLPASAAMADADKGKAEFIRNCAACHGPKGAGDGPISHRFNPPPPALAALTSANNGVFPRNRVLAIIDGTNRLEGHDGLTMPYWGENADAVAKDALAGRFEQAEHVLLERIEDIVDYIETLQK